MHYLKLQICYPQLFLFTSSITYGLGTLTNIVLTRTMFYWASSHLSKPTASAPCDHIIGSCNVVSQRPDMCKVAFFLLFEKIWRPVDEHFVSIVLCRPESTRSRQFSSTIKMLPCALYCSSQSWLPPSPNFASFRTVAPIMQCRHWRQSTVDFAHENVLNCWTL